MLRVRLRVRSLLLMVLVLAMLLGGLQAVRRWTFCLRQARRFEQIASVAASRANLHRENRISMERSMAEFGTGADGGQLDRRSRVARRYLLKQIENHLLDEEDARALAAEASSAAGAYRSAMARPWNSPPPAPRRRPDRFPRP